MYNGIIPENPVVRHFEMELLCSHVRLEWQPYMAEITHN